MRMSSSPFPEDFQVVFTLEGSKTDGGKVEVALGLKASSAAGADVAVWFYSRLLTEPGFVMTAWAVLVGALKDKGLVSTPITDLYSGEEYTEADIIAALESPLPRGAVIVTPSEGFDIFLSVEGDGSLGNLISLFESIANNPAESTEGLMNFLETLNKAGYQEAVARCLVSLKGRRASTEAMVAQLLASLAEQEVPSVAELAEALCLNEKSAQEVYDRLVQVKARL